MEFFKIEKGVPAPKPRMKGLGIDQFRQMEVGDSFVVPSERGRTFRGNAYNIARRIGIEVTIRRVDGGVRVWRVK